jgi:hypothetical protein
MVIRNIAKNSLALIFGCVFAILLGEIILRIHNPFEARVKGDRIVLPANKKYVLANKDLPGIPPIIVHSKNSLGFRGPEMPSGDFDSTLTVVAVGGSTTECFYLPDGEDWPALLGDSLKQHFRKFWINNAGFDGHSTFGHLVLMNDYIVQMHPKVVLFLIGANEIANTGDRGNEASHVKGEILFSSLEAFTKSLSAHSDLVSVMLNLYRVIKARLQGFPHHALNLKVLSTMTYPEPGLEAILEEHSLKYIPYFEKRLHKLISVSTHYGILPVLITQPTLFGPGVDPVTQTDLAAVRVGRSSGYAIWRILELYNDVTRRIGKCGRHRLGHGHAQKFVLLL